MKTKNKFTVLTNSIFEILIAKLPSLEKKYFSSAMCMISLLLFINKFFKIKWKPSFFFYLEPSQLGMFNQNIQWTENQKLEYFKVAVNSIYWGKVYKWQNIKLVSKKAGKCLKSWNMLNNYNNKAIMAIS